RLEWEGFLESLPRRGTRVPAVDPAVVRGLHRVRTALERQAARLIVGAPVRDAEADLLGLADAVEAVHRRSPERWRAEVAFHRRLVELAGCPVLLREVTRVLRLGLFHRIAALQDAEGGAEAPLGPESDHQALVRRLVAAGAADEADAIVRMHIGADKPWAEPDGGPAIEPHRETES
ncbi:MAG: FCD domain-containing protein, partial [Planctomycetota bacterium]